MKKKINTQKITCPLTFTMNFIGGKWKPIILYQIGRRINRFGLLRKEIPSISKQTLTNQLRELEADGILERKTYSEIPPRVEYFITAKGETLRPVIANMRSWGELNMP